MRRFYIMHTPSLKIDFCDDLITEGEIIHERGFTV